MRRLAIVPLLAALGWLTAVPGASAEVNTSGGGVVDGGTPVATVETSGGSSGGRGRSGGSTDCRYLPLETTVRVFDETGAEVRPGGPGQWFVRRCVDGTGAEISNESVFVGAVDPVQLAQEARRRLPLPEPAVGTSPAVDADQLVHVPSWLWVEDEWATQSATASLPGASVTVTATPSSVTWSMGNGDEVLCDGPGTPYDTARPAEGQSTDCSYTYRRSSAGQPADRYRASATVTWRVRWTATGVAGGGDLGTVSRTSAFGLRVAEAQALQTT